MSFDKHSSFTDLKMRRKGRSDWLALNPNAHEGYVSWEKAATIRKMVNSNVAICPSSKPRPTRNAGELCGLGIGSAND